MGMNLSIELPECGNEEIKKEVAVLKSGYFSTAFRCANFEEDFARFTGAKHVLAVNSATAALHLGLEALGIKEGEIEKPITN